VCVCERERVMLWFGVSLLEKVTSGVGNNTGKKTRSLNFA
jgi:hypothetical protein